MPVSFSEFNQNTYAAWLEKLQKDLKSDDVTKLTTLSTGGVLVESYLHPDQQQESLNIAPFRRPLNPEFAFANEWRKTVLVNADDPLTANKQALAALKSGSDAICFQGIGITTQEELRLTLKDIIPEFISLNFRCDEGSPALLFMLVDEFQKRKCDKSKISGSVEYDILTDYARTGVFPYAKEESFSILQAMLELSSIELPHFRNLVVNATLFHESAATEVDELAFTLQIFHEYFETLGSKLSPEKLASMARVRISCGSDYFLSIAKTRALRFLWHMFLDAWNLDSCEFPLEIVAETALRNKSIYDPYNNLVRSSLEGMAAVIGGADALAIQPHDLYCVDPNPDAWRLALNVQHLLHDEAHLDKVCDPSSGSWFIDQLTQKLVEQSWQQFQLLQNQGAFSLLLQKGIIQERIQKSAVNLRSAIRTRKVSHIGTSQFAASGDALAPFFQKRDPLAKAPINRTIEPFRETEWFEQARYYFQKKKRSSVFLLKFGDAKLAALRADFCRDLFSVLGFSVQMDSGQLPALEQIQLAPAHAADIIILCASNSDYTPEKILELKKSIGSTPIWVAGKCDNQEELTKAGVDEFVYLGCDMELIFRKFLVEMVNSEFDEA